MNLRRLPIRFILYGRRFLLADIWDEAAEHKPHAAKPREGFREPLSGHAAVCPCHR
jgi:hypothetical protein